MIEPPEDFYGMQLNGILDSGCCMLCTDRYDGCLCYDCNCTKCYWYIDPENWNGEKGRCRMALKKLENKKDGNTKTITTS